jgi:hypothetical protein
MFKKRGLSLMNYSKKIIMGLVLVVAHAFPSLGYSQETIDPRISTLVKRIQALPEHPHFTPNDFALAAVCSMVGSIIGHLGTCAIANLLDQTTPIKPRYFTPSQWNFPLPLTTVGGGLYGGYLYLYHSNLTFLAKNLNQPLLSILLTGKADQTVTRLDEFYVNHRFPRTVAFKELTQLRENLSALINTLSNLTDKRSRAAAKQFIPELLSFSHTVKNTMLLIKSDPRWLEECNAETLAMTQANMQGYQNAQSTTTAIQLAHQR